IYTALGRVPVVGDQVLFEDLQFTVESLAGRRIKKVRVRRTPPPPAEEVEHGKDAARNGNGKRVKP
ncbi:MAG TPA: hypothetical protein ENJ31_11160, partial [Anaerolineae bacterium]|nr:hypothetical protein [Anaerolineae bacterium]